MVKYTAVDDSGVLVNPLLVAGQVHGGVGQGLGQAVLEHTAYDPESGQFIAASFMDYAMPRTADFPSLAVSFNRVVNPSNEPGVVSAVPNALGVNHVDMPLTPETVWHAVRKVGVN